MQSRIANLEHPLVFGSFRNWIKLLRASAGIDARFLPRALLVILSTLAVSPLRLYERLRYQSIVDSTPIDPAPIFIIGHWRTGTTHLHNLLCQDKNLGYVSTFQAMAPGFCLTGNRIIRPLLSSIARHIHPTRLIDNIPLSFDAPQEEDFATACISSYSFVHLFTFPRQAMDIFERYVLFRDLSAQALAEWSQVYLDILRKATLRSGGKRLALKNPAHSGRLPALLKLFPDARFIHMCRDPYHVFPSMRVVYQSVLPRSQLQTVRPEQIDDYILQVYTQLMQKYLADRALIPPGNLVEVRYEDLEATPLEELRRVYTELRLPGFSQAEPAMQAYLASIAGYQKNRYDLTADVIAKVNRHWGFAFDAWGYPRLEK